MQHGFWCLSFPSVWVCALAKKRRYYHLLTGLALASPNFLLFGESNHLNFFDFSASLKIVNNRRMLSRKVALQNKSLYFGSKQPVLLPAAPDLNKLWSKVFALSKTV